jgi:peptidoglycan LD-endopeptidase LytH
VLHAKPAPCWRARVLPGLLLGALAASLGGLAVAGPPEPQLKALVASGVQVLPFTDAPPERLADRASRSRREAPDTALESAAFTAGAQALADAAARAAAEQAAREAAEKAAAEKAAKEAEAKKARAAVRSGATVPVAPVSGGTACPVPSARFTDTWGAPRSGGRAHKGTDMMAAYGAPVYAVVSGSVRSASSSAGGLSLYLAGDNGETYFYAHNSENLVRSGRVSAGQLIAKVGTSGNAPESAPHVHFERQVGGRSVNPYAFLRSIC